MVASSCGCAKLTTSRCSPSSLGELTAIDESWMESTLNALAAKWGSQQTTLPGSRDEKWLCRMEENPLSVTLWDERTRIGTSIEVISACNMCRLLDSPAEAVTARQRD